MCAAPLRRVPHGAGVVAAVIEDNRCSGRGMDIDAADVAGQLAAEGVDPDWLLWVEIVVGIIDPQFVSCAPAGGAGAGFGSCRLVSALSGMMLKQWVRADVL